MFNLFCNVYTNNEEVTFFPYRTAMVADAFIEIKCETDEEREDYCELEEELMKLTKKVYRRGEYVDKTGNESVDNHTCYMIGSNKVISFSDWRILVGTRVDIRNW